MGRPWPNILSGMRGGRMKRREHPAGNRGPDPDAGPGSRAARISRHLPKDQRLLVILASHSSANPAEMSYQFKPLCDQSLNNATINIV
jgi:hypothetical protein